MTIKAAPPNRQCKSTTKEGVQCMRWDLPGTGKCLVHSPEFHCEIDKCHNLKESNMSFCKDHMPKHGKNTPIGLSGLKLNTIEDVIAAYADTVNKVREGTFSAAQGTTLSALLGRLHEAYSDREKNNPTNIFTKALAGEAARSIGAKMTLEEAMAIAKNRSPHLVAKAIEDNAILEATVIKEKITEDLNETTLNKLLGDDV